MKYLPSQSRRSPKHLAGASERQSKAGMGYHREMRTLSTARFWALWILHLLAIINQLIHSTQCGCEGPCIRRSRSGFILPLPSSKPPRLDITMLVRHPLLAGKTIKRRDTMDLEQARALLAQAQQHRQPAYKPSIFALGGRGYYENPTTDLLAFFLDPAQIHGFGDCFLRALLSCVCQEPFPDTTLRLQ